MVNKPDRLCNGVREMYRPIHFYSVFELGIVWEKKYVNETSPKPNRRSVNLVQILCNLGIISANR